MCCRGNWLFAALCGFAVGIPLALAHGEGPEVARFSAAQPGEALPSGWLRSAIKGVARPTSYMIAYEDGQTVLRADSDSAASVVIHKLGRVDAAGTTLSWRWKVGTALKRGDPATKEGDDYAARIYVMFDYPLDRLSFTERTRLRVARALYDPELPAATLCYVWDTRLPERTIMPSPYTARVRIIKANAGSHRAGEWSSVERNIDDDFRAAFGEEPPAISGVAVATDTDNTGAKATAWYGDIVLKKRAFTAPARQ